MYMLQWVAALFARIRVKTFPIIFRANPAGKLAPPGGPLIYGPKDQFQGIARKS
jgi:hypothetical protein